MGLRKKLNILLVILLIFVSMASAAYGAVLCSLFVNLADDDGNAVSGVSVEMFRIAEKTNSTFTVTDEFLSSGINAEDILNGNGAAVASRLQQYVFSHGLKGNVKKTDSLGQAGFRGLEEGIYLVMERGNQEVSFNPYLVMLPDVMGGLHQYVVNSSPKISETDTLTVKVTIRWVDNNNAAGKRPEGVIVQLLQENASARLVRGSMVLRLAAVTGDMNWVYVFTGLDESGIYDVLQLPVSGYETTYSGNMWDGFVITNTLQSDGPGSWYPEDPDNPEGPDNPGEVPEPENPDEPDGPGEEPQKPSKPDKPSRPDKPKIPQTGAVLWPVFAMLAAGVILVIAGAADIVRGRRQ